MAELKGPSAAPNNKQAMSRALGAAFLNHQVEQLEKTVNNPTTGNWRDRKQTQTNNNNHGRGVISLPNKRAPLAAGARPTRRKGIEDTETDRNEKSEFAQRRRSNDGPRGEKDADVVVVDASVLVHALYQVKKWCRDDREEVIIIPLEALNTLDLLKKGTSVLAQRARAASRILEAQVGTNPRIRVQQDDAFVPWDKIAFKDLPPVPESKEKAAHSNQGSSPEWVRRTICCARWELVNYDKNKRSVATQAPTKKRHANVLFAVLASSDQAAHGALSNEMSSDRVLSASPVPLPAPNPHTNKHEPRSAGTLVRQWASRADIDMLEVQPTSASASTPYPSSAANGKLSSDEERGKRTYGGGGHGNGPAGRGRRNSQAGAPSTGNGYGSHGAIGSGMVERPPAVMAMMEMVAQPSKVVRLLARGEKLDPDS